MKAYCFNEQTSKFQASYSSHVLDVKAILSSSLCCTCSTKRFSGCFYPPPKKMQTSYILHSSILRVSKIPGNPKTADKAKVEK